MTHSETLLRAIFDLATAIHACRNSGHWRLNEKIQLGTAFDQLATRSALIKIHSDHVDVQDKAKVDKAVTQIVEATDLLRDAVTGADKSKRLAAIKETFEVFEHIDPLLPPTVQPFLGH